MLLVGARGLTISKQGLVITFDQRPTTLQVDHQQTGVAYMGTSHLQCMPATLE
jgi:hypothetical protein